LESDKVRRHIRKSKNKMGKGTMQLQKAMHLPQKNQNFSVTDLATSPSAVSSFCQAVLKKVIPRGFWGGELIAAHNEEQFMKKVDLFISLRRFEGMSLCELTQGMKVSDGRYTITR
jgi:hypothetical protein